jgi:hypothetical protein
MHSAYFRALLAALAVAGAAASAAKPTEDHHELSSSTRPSEMIRLASSSSGLETRPGLGTELPAYTIGDSKAKVALAYSTTGIHTMPAASRRDVTDAEADGGTGLKAWVLIMVGVFLIGTMTQRRIRSLTD